MASVDGKESERLLKVHMRVLCAARRRVWRASGGDGVVFCWRNTMLPCGSESVGTGRGSPPTHGAESHQLSDTLEHKAQLFTPSS